MDRATIIQEIQRRAAENGGAPLGVKAFERETGIPVAAWRGKFWRNWGDAVIEAGLTPNQPNQAHNRKHLICSLADLTLKLGHFPTYADVRMARNADNKFPSHQSIQQLGKQEERIEILRQFAFSNAEYGDLLDLLPKIDTADVQRPLSGDDLASREGYVYMGLLQIGREKRYKIGKTVFVQRRNSEISLQLPEELKLVHAIRTDDAYSIEYYWHKRFKDKKTKGEWFILSQEDVKAFKRRKTFM